MATIPQSSHHAQLQRLDAASLGWRRIADMRPLVVCLPWIGFAWQGVVARSSEDVFCAFLAASGAFLLLFDSFRPQRFFRYPLSTFIVIGFAVTLQLGPLLFTAIEGNTITFNLMVPTDTFWHGLLVSVVCVLSHAIYRQVKLLEYLRIFLQGLLLRLSLFQPLCSVEVIVMGAVGVFALAVSSWFGSLVESTVILKFIQGFQFLSVIPVAFLLPGLWSGSVGSKSQLLGKPLLMFIFFMALIVGVSVGRNSRAPFVLPVACLMLGLVLEWLYGQIRIRLVSILAALFSVLIFLPLATDLATAMVMVRGLRGDMPPAELVDQTISQFQDRDSIRNYRIATSDLGLTSEWSENYVSNVFLSRFTNAKYPDNSLENAARLSPSSREAIAAFQWRRLLAILPSPILSLFVDATEFKEDLTRFSFGDKLYSLASGARYEFGGFRAGHFFGTGMAGFGYGYLLILLCGLLMLFPLVDAHALVPFQGFLASPLISVVAITQFITWFSFSNSESVVEILAFPLRGFIEPVVLFALLRWLLGRVRFS
jgi:hypothetical protein